jgi:hypothetical protein
VAERSGDTALENTNCRQVQKRRRRCALPAHSKLERFHKCCSGVRLVEGTAVFLIFGFVSAQSQGLANLLLRRSLAKNQKSSLHTATSFLSTL